MDTAQVKDAGQPLPPSLSPSETYVTRLAERRADGRALAGQDGRLSAARGVLAVAFLGGLVWGSSPSVVAGLIVVALAFFGLVIVHEGVARRLVRAQRRITFHEDALARARGDWVGRCDPGLRFEDASHPYAADLDLFGRGSLFERLSTARTHSGQDALAAWLKRPAPVALVRERQAAVAELASRLDLREDLAVLGAEARRAVDSRALGEWAVGTPATVSPALRFAGLGASTAALATLAGWGLDLWGSLPFYLAAGLVLVLSRLSRPVSDRVLLAIGRPAQDLLTLTEIFDRLADERFGAPLLARLSAALSACGQPPGRAIAQLRRWLEAHDSKRNVFFAPVAFLLLWDLQLAGAVEGWRRRFGPATLAWLRILGELEALVSLSSYAFENPDDPFPVLEEGAALLHAEGISHPLLPESRSVRNDLRLDAERQMLVVTGSNMSGKSTLLRTVGINAVMALAGAPVRALSLRLSPLAVGASIRVQDSLQDGESRFYAEIKRIRQVMDLAKGATPALFLLDEMFDGTNSAERKVGAEAVVRALLGLRAIGLVTSHDLALAEIAASLHPRAANVHFEDHLEADRIAFDYRLKPGPVERGNALGLMRAVGLEV